MNKWLGWGDIVVMTALAATVVCCGTKSSTSTASNTSTTTGNNTTDANIDDSYNDDSNPLPYVLPSSNGNATFISSNSNFVVNPQAAFFDASNDDNMMATSLTVIVSSDPNLCVNFDPNIGFTYSPNTQIAVFNFFNNDANGDFLPLTVGTYPINQNDVAGLSSTMSLYYLDSNCQQSLADNVNAANNGNVMVAVLATNPNLSLTAQGNFNFTLGSGNIATITGMYNAVACGGLGDIFSIGTASTCTP